MATSVSETHIVSPPLGETLLRRSGLAWFLVAAAGQGAFIWMILAHYGRKTLSGNFAGWNDKPIIKGYVSGDSIGNAMFAVHVLLAAIVTLGGLLQLMPVIRQRMAWFHRWNGRLFFVVAYMMALGGLWLTWIRHTYLSAVSGIAVSVDGILILLFTAIAWRLALKRNFGAHRRWAMRSFMVVNGVWFLRVGIIAWALTTGGLGMNDTLSGPADIMLQFSAYLLPLAVLEIYFRGQRSIYASTKYMVGGLVLVITFVTLTGVGGAIVFMWAPYMT
jgi:hypothetical protein